MTTSNHPSAQPAKLISLYKLVDEMLTDYKQLKRNHRKFFINEVPRNLAVTAGKNRMDPYFADLFAIISSDPGARLVFPESGYMLNGLNTYISLIPSYSYIENSVVGQFVLSSAIGGRSI